MYFANQSDNQTYCVFVKSPITERTNQGECLYLKYNGKCSQSNCHYAHDPIQLKIWEFLIENEITLQLLACHQQKRKTGNLNNRDIFDRNRVVHTIVNAGNVGEFKEFIKYGRCDILQDYNQKGQSLLHVAVSNLDYDMIKFLLHEVFDCFALNDLANYEFYSFINHNSNDGFTPFEFLLSNSVNKDEKLESIFDMFIECDMCEIDKALQICKQKEFADFERRLFERQYLDQF